jgi:hypothetical protein
MSKRRWTDDALRRAVELSLSKRQVLARLGLAPRGGNYTTISFHIDRLNIMTEHFIGMG